MIVTSAPSSHQKSRWNHPRLEANDAPKATVIAMEINSIIPGCRARTSAMAPVRNGQPPQSSTTEPSTGPTRPMPGKSRS